MLKKFSSAFGLIEIMITATILAIGLLGAASIQTQSVNTTLNSSNQETATIMINQLSNLILNLEDTEIQGMLMSNTASNACNNNNCNNTVTIASTNNLYGALLVGWRDSIGLLLSRGNACLCRRTEIINTTTLPATIFFIRIRLNWVNLSGRILTTSVDNQITETLFNSIATITGFNTLCDDRNTICP